MQPSTVVMSAHWKLEGASWPQYSSAADVLPVLHVMRSMFPDLLFT